MIKMTAEKVARLAATWAKLQEQTDSLSVLIDSGEANTCNLAEFDTKMDDLQEATRRLRDAVAAWEAGR